MHYDVFISCKSEDYGLARDVYTFLVEKGYCVFFADAELRKKANAEYGKVIDAALDSARHFILVTSRKEFVESSYVESEWRTFREEKRKGHKRGNLLTILKGIDASLLPIGLRNYQSFPYSDFSNITDYLIIEGSSTSDQNEIFFKTSFWRQTLGTNDKSINLLKESFLNSRNNIKFIMEKQKNDFIGISYDTIEQIDSFWEIVDILFKYNIPVNPVEGYVLGTAFLLSSPLLSLSSTYGKAAIEETLEWKDLTTDIDSSSKESSDNDNYLSVLRTLHFREINKILSSHIPSINGYIIEEDKIRKCFSKAIETILTYNGCDWDEYSDLKTVPNRFLEIQQNQTIDLQKLSTIYRCVNTINILHGRIPDYLFSVLKKHHLSLSNWHDDDFAYQIVEDTENSNLLSIVSNFPFNKSDFHKWNVLHEIVEIIDNDIKAANSILKLKEIGFPYLGLAGSQSIQKLKEALPTEGWEPCNIGVHVGDLKYLIEKLGGAQLYGMNDRLSVIIRELIQNGRDAIKSREKMDPWFNNGGIYIHLTKQDDYYQLDISDNGIGMSKNCIQNHLLCFGESYWASALSLRENPGLKASGFNSIGHFGIGFYSLFMLANYVKVATHRYTENTGTYTTIEFLDGLTLLPIICQDDSIKSKMSTTVSFRFNALNESSETMKFKGFNSWLNYMPNRSDWPLEKKICYLVAGLDVDIYYSEGNESYRLVHRNVNNPSFNMDVWLRNLLQGESQSEISHISFDRIVDDKGQLRALLSAPQEGKLGVDVISTIRGLGACPPSYGFGFSNMSGFIDFKSGDASRNTFVIDYELNELLIKWISQHYFNNYDLLLKNFKLAKCYIEAFNIFKREFSINMDEIVDANELRLNTFLVQNSINPFGNETLALIHKMLYVGLIDTYGQYVNISDGSTIQKAITTLGLENLQTCMSKEIHDGFLLDNNMDLEYPQYHSPFITMGMGKQEEEVYYVDKRSLLNNIDNVPINNIDDIIKKYAIMFVLHPFIDGNKRALNIWMNYMLKHYDEKPIKWSAFNNDDYELIKYCCINDYNALKQMILNNQA